MYNGTETELEFNPAYGKMKSFDKANFSKIDVSRIQFQSNTSRNNNFIGKSFGEIKEIIDEHLTIYPASLPSLDLDTMSITNITLSLENRKKDKNITILRIYSTSPYIFVEKIENVTIRSYRYIRFSFAIIPLEPGQYSALIMIETDIGVIPYHMDFKSTLNPVMYAKPHEIYQIYQQPYQYVINIAAAVDYTFIFDSSVFNPSKSTSTICSIILQPNYLEPGDYLTFLYFMTDIFTNVLPVYLHVIEENYTFKQDIKLYVGNYQSADIIMTNPSDKDLYVNDIRTKDPRIFVKLLNNSLIVKSHETKNISSIELICQDSLQYDHINNFSVFVTVNGHLNLIRGEIINPPLGTQLIYYIPPMNDITTYSHIAIENQNNFSIFVFGVTCNLSFYDVKEFSPFVLGPNETSMDFFVTLTEEFDITQNPFSISIFTNASVYNFDMNRYPMPIRIVSATDNITILENNTIDFGTVLNMSSIQMSFKVFNDNHLPIQLNQISSSSNGVTIKCPNLSKDSVIKPNNYKVYKTYIMFNEPSRNTSQIFFKFKHTEYKITIKWKPICGTIKFDITISDNLILGSDYYGTVIIESKFHHDIELKGMQTNVPQQVKPQFPLKLKRYVKTRLSEFMIKLDPSFPFTRGFYRVLSNSDSYDAQEKAWKALWKDNLSISLNFEFNIGNGFSFYTSKRINISHAVFPPGIIDYGAIHADEIFVKSVYLTNPFTRPVMFKFHGVKNGTDGKFNIKHVKSITLQRNESSEFMLTFEGAIPGKCNFEIPVTTNCTPPFVVMVQSIVEYPRIRFSDIDNMIVSSVHFDASNDDEKYMNEIWTQCVYVTNNALSPISINNLYITPNTFLKFRANNTNLQPYQTCSICFDFLLWNWDTKNTMKNLSFTVLAQHYLYSLPIYAQVSENAIVRIDEAMKKTMKLVSIIGFLSPVISLLISFVIYIWFKMELSWRKKRVDRAVKHFSVKNLKEAEIQKNEDPIDPNVVWHRKRGYNPHPANETTLDLIEKMLDV